MKEEQKVWIRGVEGRGEEIVKILTGLGATASDDDRYDFSGFIYFINHKNKITYVVDNSEVASIIMDNYKEIELSSEQWKDGDVLVFNGYPDCYAVFKKYNGDDTFKAYLLIDKNYAYFDVTASVEPYHLASKEEREKASKKCYSMFQSLVAVEDKLLK